MTGPAAVVAEHQPWPGSGWCQECSRNGHTPWPCEPYTEAKKQLRAAAAKGQS